MHTHTIKPGKHYCAHFYPLVYMKLIHFFVHDQYQTDGISFAIYFRFCLLEIVETCVSNAKADDGK